MSERSAATSQRRRAGAAARDDADAKGNVGAAREAILAAARAEFAAKGLSGARVNVIAERAGVNKQLIYYYYGSKDDLYRTAIEAVYAEIRRLERGLKLGDLPPQRAMARLVGFSFDYLLEHPDFIGLLNHENAHGAVHVRHSSAIRRTNSPLIEMIRQHPEARHRQQGVSPRRRSGRAVHRGGRHVVFLLLEPADAGGDLRSRPDEPAQHRVVSPAHRGAGDERPAPLIPLASRQDLPGRSARPDTSTDSESTGHDEKPAQAARPPSRGRATPTARRRTSSMPQRASSRRSASAARASTASPSAPRSTSG